MLLMLRLGVLALFLSLVFGCTSLRVRSDWDSEISFSSLARFAWLEPPEVEGANPFADNSLLRKRLRLALHNTLTERGYLEVENPEEADFLVTYLVLLEEEIRIDGNYSSGYWGYRGHRYGASTSYADIRSYVNSTLIIDLLDPESKDLIWRGWGNGVVATRDRNSNVERLNRGVERILKRFPPDPAKSE